MTQGVEVQPAHLEHLKGVMSLERSTPGLPRWTEAIYRRFFENPEDTLQQRVLLVATVGGRICGFAAASVATGEAELESITVAAWARRSGMGTALLFAARAWAAEHDARALLLEVRSSNKAAQAFYAALGFEVTGQRPAYYNNPTEDAVLLRLNVAALQAVKERTEEGEL